MNKALVLMIGILAFAGCHGAFDRTDVVTQGPSGFVTNKVYTVSEALASGLDTARMVNSMNPTPSNPLVTVGINTIAGVMTMAAGFMTWKNKRKDQALGAIIAGVEKASTTGQIKTAISKTAQDMGVAPVVRALVKARTSRLPA